MQSDDYFARKFKAINGNMGPTTSLTASSSNESGGPANGTPAVPKMGVRARVSEWPPEKGLLQGADLQDLVGKPVPDQL